MIQRESFLQPQTWICRYNTQQSQQWDHRMDINGILSKNKLIWPWICMEMQLTAQFLLWNGPGARKKPPKSLRLKATQPAVFSRCSVWRKLSFFHRWTSPGTRREEAEPEAPSTMRNELNNRWAFRSGSPGNTTWLFQQRIDPDVPDLKEDAAHFHLETKSQCEQNFSTKKC